ncbi:MAG: hypothetical protein M0P69_12045 [Bacteroidales bacterium]|nr:hypothetical protein [Bacteroidales bacterium]
MVEDYVVRSMAAPLGIIDMAAQMGINDPRMTDAVQSAIVCAKNQLMAMAVLMDQAGIRIVIENKTWIESEPVSIKKGDDI